ncbi:MAG: metallophosphoesterase [Oscillospiraceae bacterium]|nr:metallophosphoesterase [Oscillospiraceae bacterium]
MKATVHKAELRGYRRILAISDIHGNLDYLKNLLRKVEFGPQDALVFVGDLIEKGPENLGVLRYVMQLAQSGNVWAITGNCDLVLREMRDEVSPEEIKEYMLLRRKSWQSYSIFWDMCREAGLDDVWERDPALFCRILCEKYAREIDFLCSLPTVLETEDCLFVHAGLESEAIETLEEYPCLKTAAFARSKGPRFEKTVIVGHWPVVLYGSGIARANPIYNKERNIFSIDGSCMLKYDAQLNCLIRDNRSGCWDYIAYDDFPRARALAPQMPGEDPFLFLYGDDEAEVLYEQGSLSRCRHPRTGREMDIPMQLLWKDGAGIVHVDNCGDYRLPVQVGDELSVVITTEKGYIVKKKGISGWYCGELVFV